MAILNIYRNKELKTTSKDESQIKSSLAVIGVEYKTWHSEKEFCEDSSKEEIETLFQEEIKQVLEENKFTSYDIVSVKPDMPNLEQLKEKFIPEHIHDDNEVRFFIDGAGLFCINHDGTIYQILCTKGDYISVPAKTKHWFDMGSQAKFKCIRFFENQSGWIAKYTDEATSSEYPLLDKFQEINA